LEQLDHENENEKIDDNLSVLKWCAKFHLILKKIFLILIFMIQEIGRILITNQMIF